MTNQPSTQNDALAQRARDSLRQAAAIADTFLNAAPQAPAQAPVPETKPALASTTVWGGLAAILGGLASIALVVSGNGSLDTLVPAVVSIWGGAQAIWGRWRATKQIDGVVGQP
jgi:hypothetical protein